MKASYGMLAALLATIALAGCHKKTEVGFTDHDGKHGTYAVEQSSGGTTTTVRTADGTAVIQAGGNAAAMPAGLPAYPGAKMGSDTVIAKDDGKKAGIVSFQTGDAPDAVTAFYKGAAAKAGYAIAGEMKTGDAQLLSGRKADGTGFHLTVNREGTATQVTLLAGTGG